MSGDRKLLLGAGLYGEVYKVTSPRGSSSAMKVNFKDNRLDGLCCCRESQICMELKHPYVIGIKNIISGPPPDNFHKGGTKIEPYLSYDSIHITFEIAEYNLSDFLSRYRTKFTADLVREYMSQLLLGLEYVHNMGYIHRDIKVSNILVKNNKCVLADFGMSKKDIKYDFNSPCVMAPCYRAPECVLGNNYGRIADCWSMACVLYAFMTKGFMWITYFDRNESTEDLNKRILNCIIEMLPYELDDDVIKNLPPHAVLNKRINKTKFQICDFYINNEDLNSIYDVIIGMLQFDPRKRKTASEALNMKFFDKIRDKIENDQKSYPAIKEKTIHKVFDCKIRNDVIEYIIQITEGNKNESPMKYVNHKNIFQALYNIDVFIEICQNAISEGNAKTLEDDIVIYFLTLLYTEFKNTIGTNDVFAGIAQFFPKEYTSDTTIKKILPFEEDVVKEIFVYKITSDTLYSHALDYMPLSHDDFRSMLMMVKKCDHNGLSSEEAYDVWGRKNTSYLSEYYAFKAQL